MNEVDEVKAVGIMKKMRTDLHRAIVTHMNVIGLTESEEIIERFKRWYLFDYFNVETSRALSIEGLEAAKKQLKTSFISGSQIRSWNRFGIAITSRVFRSRFRKILGWKGEGVSTTESAACVT